MHEGATTNPFNTDLDRNPANYEPLTPPQFLERAAMVLVRPDQYVSTVLPLDATTELFGILEDVLPNLNL